MAYFLKIFRCYLVGASFELITDNQVLKSFFTKAQLSRLEARWLDLFAHFGITEVTLKDGKVHVLGDALSRIPHQRAIVETENVTALALSLPNGFTENYECDAAFGTIFRAMNGELLKTHVEKVRVARLLPLFEKRGGKIFYDNKLCIPR